MQTDLIVRQSMLDLLAGYLLEGTADHKIHFVNSDDEDLCTIDFDDITYNLGPAEAVQYIFKINGSSSLKGNVSDPGDAISFWIEGKDSGTKRRMVWGSVGNLTTNSDIKFNSVSWISGTFLTINNLALVISQGV